MALLPHLREELARLVLEYRSMRQIAEELGVGKSYVYVALRSYGAAPAWPGQPFGSQPRPCIGRLMDDRAPAAPEDIQCPSCGDSYNRRGAGPHLRQCAWGQRQGDQRGSEWLLPGHRRPHTATERALARLLGTGWTATGLAEATAIVPPRLRDLVMHRAPATKAEERRIVQLLDVQIPTLDRGTARRPTKARVEPDALYD